MQKFNLGRVRGEKGEQGVPGQNATVEIKETRTGAEGTLATVVNTGTSAAAKLVFTIPRGNKGDTGPRGPMGAQGPKGDTGEQGPAGSDASVNAGTGIDITGDTISVKYGTTAGTAAQGNDSRITGAAQKSANLSDLSSASAARQNLGLGTAATRDVGESSGNVMQVGAFGVGTPVTLTTNSPIKDISRDSGNYMVQSPLDAPILLGDQWYFTVHKSGNTVATITTYRRASNQIFSTSYFNGVWTPWVEVQTTGNIRATTGQSTEYPMTQKAVTDAINSATSATPVVVATNATVTLTNNQAVYAVNTSSAVRTLTLPASPIAGSRVTIIDYANTFQTNACTVARNGKNIEGAASNLSLHLRGHSVTLLFIDNAVGWKIIAQSKQGGFA